jgi:hypothetical protein
LPDLSAEHELSAEVRGQRARLPAMRTRLVCSDGGQSKRKGRTMRSGKPQAVGHSRIRKAILRREEGRCEVCGTDACVEVHHWDGNPRNNAPENLSLLCFNCHRSAEVNGFKSINDFYAAIAPSIVE